MEKNRVFEISNLKEAYLFYEKGEKKTEGKLKK